MVRRTKPPKTVTKFKELIGFGHTMQEELNRLQEIVDSGEYTRVELSPVYTMTRHWRYMRRCALRRDEYTCQECGASDTMLHVHHEEYAPYGEEKLEDLTTLCFDCHNRISSFDLADRQDNPVEDARNRQIFEVMINKKSEEKWSWY